VAATSGLRIGLRPAGPTWNTEQWPGHRVPSEGQVWRAHVCRFPYGQPAGYPVGPPDWCDRRERCCRRGRSAVRLVSSRPPRTVEVMRAETASGMGNRFPEGNLSMCARQTCWITRSPTVSTIGLTAGGRSGTGTAHHAGGRPWTRACAGAQTRKRSARGHETRAHDTRTPPPTPTRSRPLAPEPRPCSAPIRPTWRGHPTGPGGIPLPIPLGIRLAIPFADSSLVRALRGTTSDSSVLTSRPSQR
jgi:hypothetical protein